MEQVSMLEAQKHNDEMRFVEQMEMYREAEAQLKDGLWQWLPYLILIKFTTTAQVALKIAMEKETMLSEKIATSSTTIEQQAQTIQRLQEDLSGIRLGKENSLVWI